MKKKMTTYNTGEATWTHGQELSGYNEWHRYKGPCPLCGTPTWDYGGGWRCLSPSCNKNASNPAPNVGMAPDWWNTNIQVEKDGGQWCAHYDDFTNLMESPAGFGDTPADAVRELKSSTPC